MNKIYKQIIRQIGKYNAHSIMGGRATLWVSDIITLVSTLTLVAYQGKTVSLLPSRSPHAMAFDMF